MDQLISVGAEVEVPIDAPASTVWALVTDLSLTPTWNRETIETSWLESRSGPVLGAVFRATNQIGELRWTVDCHVTRCDPPRAFEWTVLEPSHPSSSWWYRLDESDEGRTLLHHGFRHGPNVSGLRQRVEAEPERAKIIIETRTEMLRANMTYTIGQIKRRAESSPAAA